VIYALERGGPDDRARLAELYAREELADADVAELTSILERSGARDYTRDEARRYRDEALAELEAAGVVDGAAREKLEGIIVAAISA
jgi:geranylgeranyl pyrophosphate synthase